jgi:hypothetical protein
VADLTAALEIARRGAGTSEEAATNIANLLAKINSPTVTRAFAKNFGVDLPAALKAAYARARPRWRPWPRSRKGHRRRLVEAGPRGRGHAGPVGPAHPDPQHGRLSQDQDRSGQERRHGRGRVRQREALDASVAWEGFKGSVSALAITLGATLLPASRSSSRR